ncbi:hypothetical protein ACVXG7_09055 [Enterobacter hormaechei]
MGCCWVFGALPAVAATCEQTSRQGDIQGKFDASGEVCFSLPELGLNYVSATLNGVTDARLLDGQNRRIRTLIKMVLRTGTHAAVCPAGETEHLAGATRRSR